MSRPLRIEYNDAVYHVMNRGKGRSTIFHGEEFYDFIIPYIQAHPSIASISITFTQEQTSCSSSDTDAFNQSFFNFIQLFFPHCDLELRHILYETNALDEINNKDKADFVIYLKDNLHATKKKALSEIDSVHNAFQHANFYFGIRSSSCKSAVHKPQVNFFGSWLWDNKNQTILNLLEDNDETRPHIIKLNKHYEKRQPIIDGPSNIIHP